MLRTGVRHVAVSSRRKAALALALTALFFGAGTIAGTPAASAYSVLCNQAGIGCISHTGYNGNRVWGYPVDAQGNNCTNYAAFRLSGNGAVNPGNLGNAGSWATNARAKGFAVDANPVVGSIAQWNYGSAYAPGYGHVAYVEEVTAHDILLTDSNWQGGSKRWRVERGHKFWPSNFLHIRDTGTTALPGDGAFVAHAGSPEVYRIAGGAPIYVSSWSVFGGPQPVTVLAADQFARYRDVPADGTFISTNQDGRVYRMAGGAPIYVSTWSTYGGPQPTVGVDKWAVDNIGNPAAHMRAVPADGTFINTNQDGAVYRMAGGAPIYVSTWDTYGLPQATVGLDKWAVDNIGNPAAHMRAVPADGTFINTNQDGAVYRMAGGAPIYVSTWNTYGGPQPTVGIDKWAVDNATHPAAHLRPVPADGTFINSKQDGRVYRVAGGAPIYVSTWSTYGGPQPSVGIDKWAVDNVTHPAAHLRAAVSDRTFVRLANGSRRGLITRAAGGRLLGLTNCSPLGGCGGAVDVDASGFDLYQRVHPRSVDGTVLRGLPSGRTWRITSGTRRPAPPSSSAVGVNDETVASFPLLAVPTRSAPTATDQNAESAPESTSAHFVLAVRKRATRRRLRRGLLIRVHELAPSSTLRLVVSSRKQVVARRRARVSSKGYAAIRLRLSPSVLRGLRRESVLKLALSGRRSDGTVVRESVRVRIV